MADCPESVWSSDSSGFQARKVILRNSIPSTTFQGSVCQSSISTFPSPAFTNAWMNWWSSNAPLIQPLQSLASFLNPSGTGLLETISLITARPPGLSTRYSSAKSWWRSAGLTRLSTQLETTTSILLSVIIGCVFRNCSACCSANNQPLVSDTGCSCSHDSNCCRSSFRSWILPL